MLKYYNNITKTLTIPCEFNEELKDIPDDIQSYLLRPVFLCFFLLTL